MPFNPPRIEYVVFEAVSEVWSRRPEEFEEPPFEFFRAHLLKLPERYGYTRQFLWDNWSDLRKAIEECWRSKQPPESIPFALTSVFMRHATQQKNPAERILAARDELVRLNPVPGCGVLAHFSLGGSFPGNRSGS
jgi:hypothetical protein